MLECRTRRKPKGKMRTIFLFFHSLSLPHALHAEMRPALNMQQPTRFCCCHFRIIFKTRKKSLKEKAIRWKGSLFLYRCLFLWLSSRWPRFLFCCTHNSSTYMNVRTRPDMHVSPIALITCFGLGWLVPLVSYRHSNDCIVVRGNVL